MSQLQLPLRRLASQWNCSSLPDRSVLQVTGVEASTFLQGLMTNDINTLVEDERKSLYCMFLNTGGRILFDAIISKGVQPDQFLLDVDTKVSNLAKKHLSLYKVRRKILIKIEANLAVHAVFNDDLNPVVAPDNLTTTQSPVIGSTFCDGGSGVEDTGPPLSQHCLTHPDPRLANLGHRIILDSSDSPSQFLSSDCQLAQLEDFISHRCKLGVAEGADDIPLGKCTPLEYNLDYLHGVSFHKGCYLGQELTARTHHTGVIRKRILPLKLEGKLVQGEEELTVKNQAGKSVGKVRRIHANVGLGLMRLKESFAAENLTVNETPVSVTKPQWWPHEKENDTLKSTE
eukprot:TRINITY_DN24154_c0_g1_i1.p1 TRINITY_DN24154_c0_g1~~TRINITY_DN24154_c0_g1_i1.p1  ORF type:complete len:367 (-),score=95.19 TRINITY_DN24154_c0_g1_i1:99-1130(-)